MTEILDAFESVPSSDFTKAQLRSVMCVNGATIKMLIETKQIGARSIRHHRSRRWMQVVTQEQVDKFFETYVSLGELAKKEGIQANWVAAKLARQEIHPISLPDKYSKLYFRKDIEG